MVVNSRRVDSSLHDKSSNQVPFGCLSCPALKSCGGLRIDAAAWNCVHKFCNCNNPAKCDVVCPSNAALFVARVREVQGLELTGIPAANHTSLEALPPVVPLFYHGSSRSQNALVDSVAVPLAKIFEQGSGRPRFRTRNELAKHFRFVIDAKLVIMGSDQDQPIERYWSRARANDIVEHIKALEPSLVTTPNFSLFSDRPRFDDLHSMKRIAICWFELAAAGVPTALHVNSRSEADFRAWTNFLNSHPEIGALAYEFKTGAASISRGAWHVQRLCEMSESIGRPMRLICRGGLPFVKRLRKSFAAVTFVSPDPFLRTANRRRLVIQYPNRARWVRELMPAGEPIDELLATNLVEYCQMIESKHYC
jgi:hypothetical protein